MDLRKNLILLLLLFCSQEIWAGDIYVSPQGNDHHKGTIEAPLRSPIQALRMAREWRRIAKLNSNNEIVQQAKENIRGGIHIIMCGGSYPITEPLLIRPEDSGTSESPTIIRNADNESPTLIGESRATHTQLYPQEGMERIIDFNTKERTITISTPPDWAQGSLPELEGLEMVVHQRWAIAILRVKAIKRDGDHLIVSFKEPESRLEFEHPWPQPVIGGERGNSSFLLRRTEQREGIEQLLIINGTEKDAVQYVSFSGISFKNTCWNRPLQKGHVTLQGGFPILDAYKLTVEGLPWASSLENQAWIERPVAAVCVRNAHHIDFKDCHFENLASTALDYHEGVNNCQIIGNTFENIGGTAILAGSFAESPREVHRPYTDLADQCHHILIQDNYIHHATNEDWGTVGIGCGYVRDITIKHNTVEMVNYSGICVGWGWTSHNTGMKNNCIEGNTVRNFARQLYDAGGIYTLSNQPHSIIKDNHMEHLFPAPYATNNRGFAIYLDAMTDGFLLEGNTLDGKNIRKAQIGVNNPGNHIIWKQ